RERPEGHGPGVKPRRSFISSERSKLAPFGCRSDAGCPFEVCDIGRSHRSAQRNPHTNGQAALLVGFPSPNVHSCCNLIFEGRPNGRSLASSYIWWAAASVQRCHHRTADDEFDSEGFRLLRLHLTHCLVSANRPNAAPGWQSESVAHVAVE